MKLQTEKQQIPSALGPRAVALTSLRPGDWLRYQGVSCTPYDCTVIQNTRLNQRLELRWPDGFLATHAYGVISAKCWTYLGQGTERKWRRYLPRWLRGKVCRYTQLPVRKGGAK
jgi:hypothetical protein